MERMKNFFINTFEYNYQSNQRIIALIEEFPSAYSKTAQTLIGHTLNAQNIWNHRIIGIAPTQSVWEVFKVSELHKLNRLNHEMTLALLETLDFGAQISYTNSEGNRFTKLAQNIVFHIVNHSTYHRGQLMTELKRLGATPFGTDFIFFTPSE